MTIVSARIFFSYKKCLFGLQTFVKPITIFKLSLASLVAQIDFLICLDVKVYIDKRLGLTSSFLILRKLAKLFSLLAFKSVQAQKKDVQVFLPQRYEIIV